MLRSAVQVPVPLSPTVAPGPLFRAIAVVAVLVLIPLGAAFHEHLDGADAQCRICTVDATEAVPVGEELALAPPPERIGLPFGADAAHAITPEDAPGAPRGPPAAAPALV